MQKILIMDEKENAEIAAAILKGRYEPIISVDDKGLKEKLLAEKPDMILVSADSKKFDYRKVIGDTIRRNPDFAMLPAAVLSSLPDKAMESAAAVLNTMIIERPYDPFKFIASFARLGEMMKPMKERLDTTTGLHKREYTEERIQELFEKKSGTLFIIDVAKFRFASQPVREEISATAAHIVAEDAKLFKAILGVQKDRKLIGYLPDINERSICLSWGKQVIKKIQDALPDEKFFVSIGFACNDEKAENYKDLYQTCDRALNLSRERGSNTASYY
ncbi:MAG: hypothetical protein IJ416_00055 [Ruminiclostridium sp.]|nr:hypothetical protein [Ruminiclostridium sp.]